MSDDIWVLGAHMTKFGRYRDKDLIDLGAEAAMAALQDAGVTMGDMGVMGCGNLAQANGGVGQRIQKQVGQTGVPVYNVANACATGATAFRTAYMALKAGECDMGIAIGLEQMGKQGLLGAANKGRKDEKVFEPDGRYGGVMGPRASSEPASCRAFSPRPGWSTPTRTTASASSSSPRWLRRTTPIRC